VNNEGFVRLPSVLEILKPAVGPSSSHTLGPMRAGLDFLRLLRKRTGPQPGGKIRVTLCGSLAYTGRGHLTDLAVVAGLAGYGPAELVDQSIRDIHDHVCSTDTITTDSNWFVFHPEDDVIFDTKAKSLPHPNTLRFALLDLRGRTLLSTVYISIGGGQIVDASTYESAGIRADVEHVSGREIIEECAQLGKTLPAYVLDVEKANYGHSKAEVMSHIAMMWERMRRSIADGLRHEGTLPGSLRMARRAAEMMSLFRSHGGKPGIVSSEASRASIYAIAVAEENADGGNIVTAPTCGAAGVLPACLLVAQESLGLTDHRIHEALLVASLIGSLAVAEASIAGALVGCQGEIGVASAMAAAAVCYLLGGSVADQIDRAAETALEHYLGLTCDPVGGLVQIPCIERNAAGAVSALNAASMAMISGGRDRVSFDATLKAMRQTGLDMPSRYKETSLGGLAAIVDVDETTNHA